MTLRSIIAILVFTTTNAFAQKDYEPYGTMKVNNHLIADQTEILVQEWLGYIVSSCDSNQLRCQQTKRHLSYADETYLVNFRYPDSLLPDTSVLRTLEWRTLLDTSDGYAL